MAYTINLTDGTIFATVQQALQKAIQSLDLFLNYLTDQSKID